MEKDLEAFFAEVERIVNEKRERNRIIKEEIDRRFYKAVSNWVQGPIFSYMNKNKVGINTLPIKKEYLYYIISLVEFTNLISFSSAVNNVFPKMIEDTEKHPWDIISDNNLFEDQDESEIENIVDTVIKENFREAERLKEGEEKLLGFFIGKIRKATQGKADANLIKEIILKKVQEI